MANKFLSELEIFRTEEETAQQYFFAYLSVRSMAAENSDVLKMMNQNPLFWITAHHAMLLSTFVALGRIFDPQSRHNIGTLMSAVSADLKAFSITALEARKMASGLTTEEAAEYIVDAHKLTFKDVRSLRKEVNRWRRVYNKRYRDIRNKVFAHKELSNLVDVNALMAKTNVAELKELFKFLRALGLALWAAYHNGVAVNLDVYDMQMSVGERVRREGDAVLRSILEGGQSQHAKPLY